MEDQQMLLMQINYTDAEGDKAEFIITKTAEYVEVDIFNRYIMLQPFPNFYGQDKFTLKATEKRNDGHKALSYSKNFSIIVSNVNDSPTMNFSYPNGTEILVYNKHSVHLYLESNHSNYYLGNVIIFDVDANEKFYFQYSFEPNTIHYNLTQVPVQRRNSSQFKEARTVANYSLSLLVNKKDTGLFKLKMLASDQPDRRSFVTQTLNLTIWLYKNPCVHGYCSIRPDYNISCNSPDRLHTFRYFQCVCDSGYKGQWCDEIKPPLQYKFGFIWIIISIAVVLLLILVISFLLCKCCKNKIDTI